MYSTVHAFQPCLNYILLHQILKERAILIPYMGHKQPLLILSGREKKDETGWRERNKYCTPWVQRQMEELDPAVHSYKFRQKSKQHETRRKDLKTDQTQFVKGDKERNKVEFQWRVEARRHFISVFWTWTWKIQVEIHLDSEHWVFCERDDLSAWSWVNLQAFQVFTVVWHFEKYPFLLSCWLLTTKPIQLSFRAMKYKVTARVSLQGNLWNAQN